MGDGHGGAATLAASPSRSALRRAGASGFARAAWISALPCAAVPALAIAALGAPLGALLFAPPQIAFLEGTWTAVHPEPTEHARYLLALAAPLAWAVAILASPRWLRLLPARVAEHGALAAQLLLGAVLIGCFARQYELRFGGVYTEGTGGGILTARYFTPSTLLVAAGLAVTALVASRRDDVRHLAVALAHDTRARRAAAAVAAIALTAIWLLPCIQTDRSIGSAQPDVLYHVGFPLDETFAVLNGRTPLVDFSAQYANLWPYLAAVPLLALGKTLLAFTVTLTAITGLALLAVYALLHRVTRSAVAALLLYLPFLATSLFLLGGTSTNRSTVGTYYANFPLRYAGPYLLAWLTTRQLERHRGAGVALLFAAAGLVLINNVDFGAPALAATCAALAWTLPRPRGAAFRRVALAAVLGLAAALTLVALLTFVRAGSLPQPDRLVEFARVYSLGGYAMMPIPGVLGVHLVIYLTYVAAIGVATVRAARGAPNRALTGMLAWSGVFGLGSAAYYAGRSHPDALMMLFSGWALALVLLTAAALSGVARDAAPRPALAAFMVLCGFGITACSLAQLPLPWAQVQRVRAPFVPSAEVPTASPLIPPAQRTTREFVRSLADGPHRFVFRRGAPVAILLTTGHRIADAYGVVDVSPYTGIESLHTVASVDAVVAALRRAGGNTVILPRRLEFGIVHVLVERGFRAVTTHGLGLLDVRHNRLPDLTLLPWKGDDEVAGNPGSVMKWVDTHHLHPRALRGR